MYFLIFISLIIFYIFLFLIFRHYYYINLAKYYNKKQDINSKKKALNYYLKYININKDNSVLLDIAHIYHYSDKDLFQACQYYYLYLKSIKNKNDILSKKNKVYASNKIKEILEYNISQSNDININKNYTKYTNYTDSNFSLNDYLINNILDGFNKQNLFSNQNIQESHIIQELHNTNNNTNNQTNQEEEYIINNIDINVNDDIIDNTIYHFPIDDVPIHRPILNDNQNIHDTYINNTIFNSINNIKIESNTSNLTIDEINNIIKNELDKKNFDEIKKNNILQVLNNINTNLTKSYKNNMTLSELLVLIFNRIYSKNDENIKNTFLSNLIIELNDCIENNNIVCHTGIFNRIINSINLLDNEVNIKTYDFLNEEIMNKCIAIRNTIDPNIPNYEDVLKNKIKIEMNKDYIESKILTQSQLDDVLNIWIDHI
jgi:hypothetical protein